jgi:hypothetical protein
MIPLLVTTALLLCTRKALSNCFMHYKCVRRLRKQRVPLNLRLPQRIDTMHILTTGDTSTSLQLCTMSSYLYNSDHHSALKDPLSKTQS